MLKIRPAYRLFVTRGTFGGHPITCWPYILCPVQDCCCSANVGQPVFRNPVSLVIIIVIVVTAKVIPISRLILMIFRYWKTAGNTKANFQLNIGFLSIEILFNFKNIDGSHEDLPVSYYHLFILLIFGVQNWLTRQDCW